MYLSRPSSISNSCDKDERNVAVTDYRRLMPKTEQKVRLCLSDLPVSVYTLISAPFRLSFTILYLLSPFSL